MSILSNQMSPEKKRKKNTLLDDSNTFGCVIGRRHLYIRQDYDYDSELFVPCNPKKLPKVYDIDSMKQLKKSKAKEFFENMNSKSKEHYLKEDDTFGLSNSKLTSHNQNHVLSHTLVHVTRSANNKNITFKATNP